VSPARRVSPLRRVADRGVGALAASSLLVGGRVRARGAVVLAYHDVHDDPAYTTELLASPARFRGDLQRLQAWLRVTDLQALCDRADVGSSLDGFAAVSFDDALQGVARHAVPILAELGVPATVFAVPGAGQRRPRSGDRRGSGCASRSSPRPV
jgi:peptidoglycan/xylan/chitin deacetylase (PgdA/CDA1 family)